MVSERRKVAETGALARGDQVLAMAKDIPASEAPITTFQLAVNVAEVSRQIHEMIMDLKEKDPLLMALNPGEAIRLSLNALRMAHLAVQECMGYSGAIARLTEELHPEVSNTESGDHPEAVALIKHIHSTVIHFDGSQCADEVRWAVTIEK